ncbi:MAG: sigma-70 family RNA polymerase sigma factor [Planctomycetes bacterium]|nr:sigma-70 family RNA polymerase sigma factor [Planctomycetota bacterium]
MTLRSRFEKTACAHIDAVYRAAFALCGARETAGDLVQTTFLKAFENFGSFKTDTNCKAWLMRILRNTWIDRLRRQKTAGPHLPLDEDGLEHKPVAIETVWSNPQDLLENFSDEQVIKALASLADDQRLTLFLVDVEGFSQEDVAKITGVAVGTVKSRTSRARAALREHLSSWAEEMGWTGGRQ